MRNLYLLAFNTLKITFRKKFNILVYLVIPVLVVLFTMSVYQNDNGAVSIGIYNQDTNGAIAKDFVEAIKAQGKYDVQLVKETEINNLVATGKVDCVVTIPENFDEEIYNHSFSKLDIKSIKGKDATGFIQSYLNYYIKNLMDLSLASAGNKATFDELYKGFKSQTLKVEINLVKDESQSRAATVYSVGFLIMFMMYGANNTSGFILKEKREKTYNRIFSTPVNSRIYLGGNILANMCLMIVQSVLVVYASKHIFKLSTGVGDLQLLTILITFGLCCVTLGILLVAFSQSTSQTGYMSVLIITPTCMISGCFWPINYMPNFMQQIANFLPQTWALRAVTELQNGKNFVEIIPHLGIILAFALAFFLIGIYKMKISDSVSNFV